MSDSLKYICVWVYSFQDIVLKLWSGFQAGFEGRRWAAIISINLCGGAWAVMIILQMFSRNNSNWEGGLD